MEILIDNMQTRTRIDLGDLRRKTELILEGLGYKHQSVLSIVFVDAAKMAELNYKYRGKEGPTNVLSFSQIEGERVGADEHILGDVVICTDKAVEDADDLGYSVDEMILYLLIHGILHLSGYMHEQPTDEDSDFIGPVNYD